MKKTIFMLMFMALLPSVLADIVAPPAGAMIWAGIVVMGVMLALNYGINFVLAFSMATLAAKTEAKAVAKGLLIITPIILVLESFFISVIDPWYSAEFTAVWMFSFAIIFICYFIVGEKMWDMAGWKAVIVAGIMAVVTNPTYLLLFY